MLGNDFISITKDVFISLFKQKEAGWDSINYEVFDLLLDYLTSPTKIVIEEEKENSIDPNDIVEGDSETIRMIKELISTYLFLINNR